MKRNFARIKYLCSELYRIRTGEKKPSALESKKVQDFWVKFMGFHEAIEMKAEDIQALETILINRINTERKRRGLPGILKWYQI